MFIDGWCHVETWSGYLFGRANDHDMFFFSIYLVSLES